MTGWLDQPSNQPALCALYTLYTVWSLGGLCAAVYTVRSLTQSSLHHTVCKEGGVGESKGSIYRTLHLCTSSPVVASFLIWGFVFIMGRIGIYITAIIIQNKINLLSMKLSMYLYSPSSLQIPVFVQLKCFPWPETRVQILVIFWATQPVYLSFSQVQCECS